MKLRMLVVAMLSMGCALAVPAAAAPAVARDPDGRSGALHRDGEGASQVSLPAGARVFRDLAYGPDPAQRFDL